MTVTATFTGTPNDPNYIKGSTYNLTVKGKEICKTKDNSGVTVYGSIKAFLTNWSNVQVISSK